ncbi:carbohydrate binding domain-containing protein [Streptomyces sp. MNP-20]|uniref:carbohydrate binding domain-containing protein n=1 Tax=Streptomyces sp. MNP-20 TaxID=2721165 RepID=UPI0015574D7F|nr:carbohydrate binding domain-containing protein [Streptomyces sp. MNP-20]
MTRLVVEAGFGSTMSTASPTWTDITQWVDVTTGVSIDRGASDELSEIQAGTCSLALDNSDGRFTAGLASSPYYPNVKKNVPIRVRVVTTAKNLVTNPSFESGVADWTASATPSISQSATHVQHGSQAMLMTFGGGAVSGQNVRTTLYGLDIGQRYTASAYVWVPTGDTHVHLRVDDVADGSPSTTLDAFQRITVTFTATATQHVLRVRSQTTPAAGDLVWIDAVQTEEGAAATAFDSDGAQLHARFYGMVNDWPTKWRGLYATAPIVCTDIFKILARQEALQPMLVEEVLLDRPTVYFPLGEPADSTTAGDLTGTADVATLSIVQAGSGGTLAFGEDQGPPGAGDMPAPVFTPASSSAGKYLTANLGQAFFDANVNFRARTECWFSTSTDGRVLMALTSLANDVRLIISLESGTGKVKLEYMQDLVPLTSVVIATPNLADGALHHVHFHELNDELYVDGVMYSAATLSAADLRVLYVGGFANARLWNGTISHVAVYLRAITSAEITPHYTTGTTQHVGETAAVRMARIASYVPVTVTTQGSIFDGMAAQAALGSAPLTHLQEIATTESGKLIADRASNGLIFQSRDVRYNQVSAVSLEFADLETDELEVSDDDQKMINTVTASRPGGATQRVVDQTARDTYGPYEKPLDLLKSSDLKVLDAANWTVSRYADPPTEIRQVPVDAYTMPLSTYRALLTADVSTLATLTGLPAQAPAATASVTVEGYTETITRNRHLLDFHTSRAQTDTVWVLDDPTYSVLGSTTRLAY